MTEWPRAAVLRDAAECVTNDRNNKYGPPTQDFDRAALALNALGFRIEVPGQGYQDLRPHHVAMIQAVVKLSRLTWSPAHRDSWVDLAGYAACGYECVSTGEEEKTDGSEECEYCEGPCEFERR